MTEPREETSLVAPVFHVHSSYSQRRYQIVCSVVALFSVAFSYVVVVRGGVGYRKGFTISNGEVTTVVSISKQEQQQQEILGSINNNNVDDVRDRLLKSATSLCDSFATKKPIETVINNFSRINDDKILCYEHGLQELAPFLGRDFVGRTGAKEYFTIISNLLSYEDMKFSDYIVDTKERAVSVKGKATFIWKSTGNSWDEVFTYRLQFDDEFRITVYEVWADSGAAYLASMGQLE